MPVDEIWVGVGLLGGWNKGERSSGVDVGVVLLGSSF